MTIALQDFLFESALRHPDKVAVENGDDSITYRRLAELSEKVCGYLVAAGVRPGDRVGVYLPKSIDGLAVFHGTMMSGAAYVPADPNAPASRAALVHDDCQVRVAVIDADFAEAYATASRGLGAAPTTLVVDDRGLAVALGDIAREPGQRASDPDSLAYVLYTSGSTGRPKGVMLTHRNATSFVDWCSETFAPSSDDRCSSHAPFHFDLSILDIYMAFKHGATLVLIPDSIGKDPERLAAFAATNRISIWYSAPSILSLMAQFGNLPSHDLSALRMVLFAGEVFPVKHLRRLQEQVPWPAYYNLYGPTETNVCTWFRIPDRIPAEQTQPFPIGYVCSHLEARAIDSTGRPTRDGDEGELIVRGPAVTQGYWNLPERNESAFYADQYGSKWYRTGDIVVNHGGCFTYLGRRDRMIKKRGYRIELGEIESCLYQHPQIKETGVIATTNDDGDVQIVAAVVTRDGTKLSLISLKRFVAERLPKYMVPDRFVHEAALPRTSTDKVDYQQLNRLGSSS
jgi:amino acid adenylation domain-containing protein